MKRLLLIILSLLLIIVMEASDKKNLQNINKLSDDEYVTVDFNRINLLIDNIGTFYYGSIDTNYFLFSSGFFISGINASGEIWVGGVYPSNRINSFVPGTTDSGPDVRSLYYISRESKQFGQEWEYWKEAVNLGAEFYDGDNDGIYNPIDKNNNGIWDPSEDRPAIYGDVMVWTVFNDGGSDTKQGINIRQTVWSEKSIHGLEKVVFVKYSLENASTVSEIQNDVMFSLAADPDIGFYGDDLLGCNAKMNEAFTYYHRKDKRLNDESISFITKMIQGPIVDDISDDIGYKLEGEDFNVNHIASSLNIPISAMSKIDRNISPNNPELLRSRMGGLENPDPCSDFHSRVYNQDCNSINNVFQFSGNPIKKDGWVNIATEDQQYLLTSGLFNLNTGHTQDIIYAFVVGTGEDGTDALIDAKNISKRIKYTYFDSPTPFPELNCATITYDNSIEIVWETDNTVNYNTKGYEYNIDFEGYEVIMYNSPSTVSEINNTKNSQVIARYDIKNEYNRILIEDDVGFNSEIVYEDGVQMDPYAYSNPDQGRLLLKVNWDPFNNEPLRKGKPYYFSITPFGLNYGELIEFDSRGSYIVPADNYFGMVQNDPVIINDNKGNSGIVIGENLNDSFFRGVPLEHVEGESEAELTYSIYDQESLTNDTYQLSFTKNEENPIYQLFFSILNVTKNKYLLEDQLFNGDYADIKNLHDGFVVNLNWVEPGEIFYSFEGNDRWFKQFNEIKSGIFYVGRDLKKKQNVFPVSQKLSNAISVDKLRKVELHFSDSSKAYRYMRRGVRYTWQGIENVDSGYVQIPVSAYTVDRHGNKRQVSIAFLENAFPFDSLGNPDGKWNPGTDVSESKEYLAIFNAEYSDDPYNHLAYTGIGNKVPDIAHGYTDNQLPDSTKNVGRSPWFDAMYIIGFETENDIEQFEPTGIFTIEPAKILTPHDKYMWKVKREKLLAERKEQFEKINVYPNPLFGYNSNSNAFGFEYDEPFITFSNLPQFADIKIYSLSGNLIRSIHKNNNSASERWDLKNESGNRIASGMYVAIVEVPEFGQKVLKIAIIQPQKRVHFK